MAPPTDNGNGFDSHDLEIHETALLHPGADLLITAAHPTKPTRKWRVASSLLRLASQVFDAVLGAYFGNYKGYEYSMDEIPYQVVSNGGDDVLDIPDVDPEALGLILCAIHYQSIDNDQLEPQMIALVARYGNELDCNMALRPWLELWLRNTKAPECVMDYGWLFIAAYTLGYDESIISTSKLLIQNAKAGSWSTWLSDDAAEAIPMKLQEKISISISTVLYEIHARVQSVDERLKDNAKAYHLSRRLCPRCGRLHPDSANKCNPCDKNPDLVPAMCTRESRIGEYLLTMRQGGLWPALVPFSALTVSELITKISDMAADMKHKCSGEGNCPLVMEMGALPAAVKEICSRIEGVSGR